MAHRTIIIIIIIHAFTIGIWYNSTIEYASEENKKKSQSNVIAVKRKKNIFFFKTLVDERPPTATSCVVNRICNRGTLQASSP